MTQFIAQYFNILSVGRGNIFDHLSRKKLIIKCFKNIRCSPYILVLKFGLNLIITAVAEFCVMYKIKKQNFQSCFGCSHFPFLQCIIIIIVF